MKWFFKRLYYGLGIFSILFFYLFLTESGLKMCVGLVGLWVPGKLTLQEINGYLLHRIDIKHLAYQNNQISFTLDNLVLKWDLRDLLKKHIRIQELYAENMQVEILERSSQPNMTFTQEAIENKITNAFPHFHLDFDNLKINHFNLKTNSQTIFFGQMHAFVHFDENKIQMLHQWEVLHWRIDKKLWVSPSGFLTLNLDKKKWKGSFFTQIYFPKEMASFQKIIDQKTKYPMSFSFEFKPASPYQGQIDMNLPTVFLNAYLKGPFFPNQVQTHLDFHWKGSSFFTDPVCFSYQSSQMCFNLSLDKNFKVEGKLSHFPLDVFNNVLPSNNQLFGFSNAKFMVEKINESFLGNMHIESNHSIWKQNFLKENLSHPIDLFDVNITLLPSQQFIGSLELAFDHRQNTLKSNLSASSLSNLDAPISWETLFHFKNFSFYRFLVKNAPIPSGQFFGKLNVFFQNKVPKITSDIYLKNGILSIPAIGTQYSNLEAHITSQKPMHHDYFLKGVTQNKPFVLSGNLEGELFSYPITIHINGEHFPLIDSSTLQIEGSPKLTLTFSPNLWTIEGLLTIPKAHIAPNELNEESSHLPDDAVIVSRDVKTSPMKHKIDLTIHLGDEVMVNALGLEGLLKGNLRIKQEADRPPLGYGELHLEKARYRAYGQNLQMRRGNLIYFGTPLTNPLLDIEAIQTIVSHTASKNYNDGDTLNKFSDIRQTQITLPELDDKKVVGLRIRGLAKEPHVQLFSEPASLSQADILSYLVLGCPIDQANRADTQQLLRAASVLSIQGHDLDNMQDEFKNKLGLDELGVETALSDKNKYNLFPEAQDTNTSLVLGKKFSDRLYVNYSLGLIDPTYKFKLTFKLSRHLNAQTETSTTGNSIDLFYTIERK